MSKSAWPGHSRKSHNGTNNHEPTIRVANDSGDRVGSKNSADLIIPVNSKLVNS